MQRAQVAMAFLRSVELGLGMERFSLETECPCQMQPSRQVIRCVFFIYLKNSSPLHPSKPQSFVILFAATASTKESASTQFDPAIVDTGHGRGNEVPICLCIEVIQPSWPVSEAFQVSLVASICSTSRHMTHSPSPCYAVQLPDEAP